MSEEKQYYAFISYKREDKKEAKRLQHQLEYYRLPNQLRKDNPDLPEYVRPVFRDMTDLEVGELSTLIHEALEQSHYLIVVCSPRAAQSKWVNDEVEYFISLGKQDKIIPYIIEGIPHAEDPSEECYPPALLQLSKEKELLGANINEVGKEAAGIRVVAKMFNIRFDILYQRYKREQRRKFAVILSLVIAFILLLLSFLGYVIYSNHELQAKNELINQQNNYLIQSRDSTRIALQNVRDKNDTISQARNELEKSNLLLLDEQDKVKRENWKMLENQSLVVASKAEEILEQGDSYTAILLALEVLPKSLDYIDRPIVIEAERVLRTINYKGHSNYECNDFNYSEDGKYIVTVGGKDDKLISLFDFTTNKLLKSFYGDYNTHFPLISPNGQYLAYSTFLTIDFYSDDTPKEYINIIDIKTGQVKYRKKCSFMNFMRFDDSGDKLIFDTSSGVCVWDIPSNRETFHTGFDYLNTNKNEGRDMFYRCGIFNPTNNKQIAYVCGNNLYIYNGEQSSTCVLQEHHTYINSIAYHPSGRILYSISVDGTIKVWDTNTNKCIKTISQESSPFSILKVSHSGKYIIVAGHDSLSIYDTNNYAKLSTYPIERHSGNLLIDNNDLQIAYVNKSGRISYLPLEKDIILRKSYPIKDMVFNKEDNKIYYISNDEIYYYDLTQKIETSILRFPDANYILLMSASNAPTLGIINVKSFQAQMSMLNIETRLVTDTINFDTFSFSRLTQSCITDNFTCVPGSYVKGVDGNDIAIFKNDSNWVTIKGHRFKVCDVSINNQKTLLASASVKGEIIIWDIRTHKKIKQFIGYECEIIDLIFSPNDKYLMSFTNQTIQIWNPQKGCIMEIRSDTPITSACFGADDSKIIYSKLDGTINEYTISSLSELLYRNRTDYINCTLTPEERRKYYLE